MANLFRRMVVSLVLVGCMACADTPTAPTPLPPPVPQILDLSGQWRGTYTVTACTETGSAVGGGFCTALGTGGGLGYTPTQTGSSLGGTVVIGGFSVPVQGNVAGDVVSLAGSGPVTNDFSITLASWRFTVSGNSMTGNLSYTILTRTGAIGSANVSATGFLTR